MVKILEIISEPFSRGGEEAFIINVIKNITEEVTIDLYAPFGFNNDNYQSIIESRGGKVIVENPPLKLLNIRINIVIPLLKILCYEHYDVIHIHSSNVSPLAFAAFAAKIKRTGTICVHSHSTGESNSVKHKIAKMVFNPLLYMCPTNYFACSKDAGKWKFPERIVNKKLDILKNGIDLNRFRIDEERRQIYRKELGYGFEDFVVGHVGRMAKEKNHEFIIDIFSELHKKDIRYKLLLLGDGNLKEAIQAKVENLGLSDSVFFTGNVSNVQDYMQAMDLFVLPSLYEGLPLTSVEAQACGLPCVFSTGVPEEAKLIENVEFVSLDDKQKWIDTIENMIALPKADNTEKIRMAGYDITDTAKKLEEIYLNR